MRRWREDILRAEADAAFQGSGYVRDAPLEARVRRLARAAHRWRAAFAATMAAAALGAPAALAFGADRLAWGAPAAALAVAVGWGRAARRASRATCPSCGAAPGSRAIPVERGDGAPVLVCERCGLYAFDPR